MGVAAVALMARVSLFLANPIFYIPFTTLPAYKKLCLSLLVLPKRKRTKNRNHGLNASVKKRMELFTAGAYMSQRQKTATASLSANDYGNEPSMVEIRDPDGGVRVP